MVGRSAGQNIRPGQVNTEYGIIYSGLRVKTKAAKASGPAGVSAKSWLFHLMTDIF
jgi:hypothetical protein